MELAKSFGRAAIPKALAASAPTKCDGYSWTDPKRLPRGGKHSPNAWRICERNPPLADAAHAFGEYILAASVILLGFASSRAAAKVDFEELLPSFPWPSSAKCMLPEAGYRRFGRLAASRSASRSDAALPTAAANSRIRFRVKRTVAEVIPIAPTR